MYFVTGASGFVGSYLLYYLSKQGIKVVALKRKGNTLLDNKLIINALSEEDGILAHDIYKNIHWIEGDILDEEVLMEALENTSKVFHCAAKVSFQSSQKKEVMRANYLGTQKLVNLCIENGTEKIIHLSSVGALNKKDNEPITESNISEIPTFGSIYAESKFRAEMEVWRANAEGIPIAILNPGIILGFGRLNYGSNKIIQTVQNGLTHYPLGVNGFVWVNDVAKQLVLLSQNEAISSDRFISVENNYSYKQLFDILAHHLKTKPPTISVPNWQLGLARWVFWMVSILKNDETIVTKETAQTAGKTFRFNNNKFLEFFPDFKYTPLDLAMKNTVDLLNKHKLI